MVNRLLINRAFAGVWSAGAVSWVGDFVFDTTVLLWISTVLAKDQPWAPAAASGVLLAVLVPGVIAGPIAGVFVDRWDPRRTMLWSDAIRAVLVGALVVLPLLPAGTLPVAVQLTIVYATVVLNTIVSRFFTPARFTIIADIVPEADQPRAAGITQATSAAAGIVGPPLAAPLLFTAGIEWALVVNALSFVLSYLIIWKVRTPKIERKPAPTGERGSGFWQEFLVGVQTIGRSQVLLAILIMGMIANIAAQTFNALGVFFVTDNLNTPARYFGLQDAVMGVGVVVGAALAGWLAPRLGYTRTIWGSMLAFGLCLGVYARTTSFVVALLILLLAAVPLGGMNTAMSPLMIQTVPREVLGRVFATFVPGVQSIGIAGVAFAGWISSSVLRDLDTELLGVHFGTYDTVFLCAGLIVVASGLYGMVALRRATQTSENAAAQAAAHSRGE
ncbi:MFS transporter [Actinopolymorpha alba]|uniref:MFS transporter n=1 Tax=Actinopolymorpha alba TaxID=533267 RepID=UPI0012F6F232|nr:MFS transporter [Actinopolymorpha alba]